MTARMTMPVLVLDTNVVGYTPVAQLEKLAKRFRLRISEGALLERWVHCVGIYEESRPEARAKFFRRFRSIAPFIDAVTPVAPGGGNLLRAVIAAADGQPPVAASEQRAAGLREQWECIIGVEHNDEEWVSFGRGEAAEHLEKLDDDLKGIALPRAVLARKVEAKLQDMNRAFDDLPEDEQMRHIHQYVVEVLKLSPEAADRLDAHTRNMAYRLQAASVGRRLPKRNDGVDFALTGHVGEGHFLVTREKQLVEIVDESGTYQAAWVRWSDDLDDLPDGFPW